MDWRKLFGPAQSEDRVEDEERLSDASAASKGDQRRQSLSADRPIEIPEDDLFGYDPFARAIATSLAGLDNPEGLVIGIHGPWGSGKSSAINLVKHHLRSGALPDAKDLVLVEFNPWWFSGADALALAFFSEIGAAIGKSLPEKAKEAFRSLGRRISSASSLVEAAVNLATFGTGGATAGSATKLFGDTLAAELTVVQEHAVLSQALRKADKRYLVIIDDLDRLSADDALLIFRLVKSVGRLPNVIYLMVFDRQLTEAAVASRFPSEGAHFLEKIVQASFELPPPEPDDLRGMLMDNVGRIMGDVDDDKLTRFMNVFYDVVAPEIRQARDVVRLTNALEVSWPAVRADVDKADFLAIETLRLFRPGVHREVYDNMILICGHELNLGRNVQAGDECDRRLLATAPEADRPALRKGLMRLFPALESGWSNLVYGTDYLLDWRRDRRICVESNFSTYFRFAPSDQVAPATEIETFIAGSGDVEVVRTAMREALATRRRRHGTRAGVLLDELTFRAGDVPADNIEALMVGLFGIADELDVEADSARGMGIGDNQLRLHWLMNRLVGDRLAVAEREPLLERAAAQATLVWLVNLAIRCKAAHKPEEGKRREREPLVGVEAADRLAAMALERIETAAANSTLLGYPDPVSLLLRWRDLLGEGGVDRVRAWLAERLDDTVVIDLARSFVSTGWSHTVGDVVSRARKRLERGALQALVDPDQFRDRVARLRLMPDLAPERKAHLDEFEAAWLKMEKGDFDD